MIHRAGKSQGAYAVMQGKIQRWPILRAESLARLIKTCFTASITRIVRSGLYAAEQIICPNSYSQQIAGPIGLSSQPGAPISTGRLMVTYGHCTPTPYNRTTVALKSPDRSPS
jgi:hypothetical protein